MAPFDGLTQAFRVENRQEALLFVTALGYDIQEASDSLEALEKVLREPLL